MRKKLDTRFPAARIKKIMQADEDIGKIAMAVPLLVSKALELFLQDLCDRTYEITLKKGAKTVNSLHLKQCVQSFNVFDFLKDTVSRVPDLGSSDAAAAAEDRSVAKRRKISEDEEDGHEDESKRAGVHETGHTSSTGRGRGRGRGKGRGRGSRQPERESTTQYDKFEEDPDLPHNEEDQTEKLERPENVATSVELKNSGDKDADKRVRNFDLNIDLNENGDSNPPPSDSARKASPERKNEEIPGWSLEDVQRMAGGSVQFATLNGTHHEGEEEEDYDEE